MSTNLLQQLSKTRAKGDAAQRIEKEVQRIRRIGNQLSDENSNVEEMNEQVLPRALHLGLGEMNEFIRRVDEDELLQLMLGEVASLLEVLQFGVLAVHRRVDRRVEFHPDHAEMSRSVENEKTRGDQDEHSSDADRLSSLSVLVRGEVLAGGGMKRVFGDRGVRGEMSNQSLRTPR